MQDAIARKGCLARLAQVTDWSLLQQTNAGRQFTMRLLMIVHGAQSNADFGRVAFVHRGRANRMHVARISSKAGLEWHDAMARAAGCFRGASPDACDGMAGGASWQMLGKLAGAQYHARGSVRCVVDGMGARTSMTIDAFSCHGSNSPSQMILRIDARSNRVTQGYDLDGRPIKRIYPDGTRVTQGWDAVSNRLVLADLTGRYTSTFDSLNRLRTRTTPANKTITLTHDAISRRRVLQEPEGGRFTYLWDDAMRCRAVINPQGERTSWSFNSLGQTILQRLASGSRVSSAYDADQRLIRLANLKSDGTTFSSFVDRWDGANNRLGRVESSGNILTWSYDNTYQLTREQRSGANSYDISYLYDAASNRRVMIDNGVRTTYTCDAANQLTKILDNTGTTTLTWDSAGNQRTEKTPAGAVTTNTWSIDNMLTRVALASGVINTMTYDGDLKRVKLIDSTGTSKAIWDNQKILVETNASDVTQAIYTSSPGRYGNLISQRRSGTTNYYLFDPLGSTDRLLSAAEAVTDSYLYKAFGSILASTGTTTNPWRFVGRLGYFVAVDHDHLFVRARWLAPGTGRFTIADPYVQESPFFSPLYGYADNSPIVRIDPTGELVVLAPGAEVEDNPTGIPKRQAACCLFESNKRRFQQTVLCISQVAKDCCKYVHGPNVMVRGAVLGPCRKRHDDGFQSFWAAGPVDAAGQPQVQVGTVIGACRPGIGLGCRPISQTAVGPIGGALMAGALVWEMYQWFQRITAREAAAAAAAAAAADKIMCAFYRAWCYEGVLRTGGNECFPVTTLQCDKCYLDCLATGVWDPNSWECRVGGKRGPRWKGGDDSSWPDFDPRIPFPPGWPLSG